jgi:regulator of replication initiation timing
VNQSIQEQNKAQKSEIDFLRKQIDSINKDMGAVKDQMKNVTSDVELLKQQNQVILDRLNKMPIPTEQQTKPKDKPSKKDSVTPKPDFTQVNKPVIVAPGTTIDKSTPSNTNSQSITSKSSVDKSIRNSIGAVEKQNDNVGTMNKSKEQESNSTRNDTIVSSSSSSDLNSINEITAPIDIYNVVVGAYTSSKFALIYRNKLRSKGYDAAVFRSTNNSRILRVCVISTPNKRDALRVMRKVRAEIDPKSWIHVYKK